MTDTITVIANPTPEGTLDPEEFCEGTLGNSEPTKTIAGLTGASIVWYDADTTATTSFSIIPEPAVKDLTVAAGSTNRTESFYYVLVSDDGCRSGIQTYDVTVNKADRFPIADKTSFEYKKVEFGTSEWGSLKANKPTLFASMSSANKYYYGDITGANTESEPDLATATLGTESETVPTPTVADKDDPDPEYLWYWAYMVDGNGCHSDTVRLEAIIQGAPMPTPHNDVYCINTPDADVKTIDQYAETNPVDATDVTLNFYKDKAKTQPISDPSTFKPDMTQAGPQDYWVTQSSATSGESAPAKITITVYDVPKVTLANPSAVYCLNETPTVALEDEVTNAATPYVLELFKGTQPTIGVPPATAAPSTMAITDDTKGQTDYFARFQLEISEPAESITKYCYGEDTKYTVDVQSVDKPTGSGYIQYLKDDLASSPKLPTLQDPSAIVFDPSYTPQWYDKNMDPINESQAIPPYNASATTDKPYTFYVTQKSAKPCESDPLEVTIVVSATPMPVPTPLFLCDGVSYPANLDAYAALNPATVGNFELRWFETGADGKADLTANSGDGFASITLSPTIQKTDVVGGVQKEITEYTYWVLQREVGNPGNKSSAAPVKVTVYANPQLVANPPAVKCKGETINLKDMFTCDVDNVTGTWYQSGSSSAISDYQHVGESGVYDMVGEYTKDGVTCKSNTASVTLKFHDYSVSTDGSHTTCPGVSVDDITAVVDINDNSVDPSDLIYSWSTDFNSETGSANQFSTTSVGLENEGTVGNVKLEVTTAACTASMAAHKATHDITVGKGILDGSISFSERDNSKTLSKSISDAGIAFPSCGGSVAVKLENVKDEDNANHKFTYAKTPGGSPVDGKFDASGNASLDLEAGKYVVEFTNKCPTKFEFEIIDMHNTADEEHTNNLSICEGEDWYAKIIDIQGPAPDKIEWYLDNTLITGASSDKHQLSPSAQIAHSGVYSYKLYSAGCVFDGKIARGAPLKVKPYAKFKSGINTHYEIVYGEPVTMDVDFDVPSNVSDIVSSVKWNDRNVGFSESGSAQVSISPVEQDYHLTVVADEREVDFCKAEINIDVLVDANLDIEAHFEKNIMCVGDEMFLYVDTSGTTGNVLHPANMDLHVVEGSASRPVAYSEKYKAYGVVVSPSTTTQYSVVYTYSNPTTGVSQDKSIAPTAALLMEVVPPINVTFPPVRTVCEGEPVDINITVTPAGTTLEWDSDNQEVEVHSADGLAISVTPVHSSPGIARQIKAYKAVASNEYCNPKTVQTSVAVDKPITGEIVAKDSICQFDMLDLDASSYMATSYEWTYDETGAVFNGPALSLVPEPYYANFSLHMERGECVLDTFKFVEVTTAPLVMTVDSLDYRKVEIVLESGAGSAPFQFIIDGNTEDPYLNEAIRDNLTYTTHSLKVVDKVGCVTETTFSIKEPKIIIPIIVSPDENGVNDKFVVKGLAEGYPDAKVTIFDRWGKQLATYKAGDDVDWDGIYNGHPMPSTDYWYEIQIKEIKKTYTGHFTLIRQ
ncbi:MAG: T9SS type B sorting domain-containing protein [Bacteroidales bacterium]|nr:T9SS type B sorting domain-containing protein [Bacteroidales bacterium]